MSNYSLDSNSTAHLFTKRTDIPMHSDLDILGREAGSSPPSLSSALGGPHHPIKYPPFPTLEDSLTLCYPTVKSMRGTHLRSSKSALIITYFSTGEER
jgi:hypothetical protein